MSEEYSVLEVQKAWMWFFVGYFFMATVPWIFPALTDLLSNTEHSGIIEIGIILFEILLIIVLPLAKASDCLLKKPTNATPQKETILSILVLIFGLAITYFGFYMITSDGGNGGLISAIEGTFQQTLFWIGLIGTWAMTVIVAPINTIIKVNN